MKENKVYFQVTLRKFDDNRNRTLIYTYNDSLEAYKFYDVCKARYNAQEDIEKMRSAVEFYVVDRTAYGVKQLSTICACGYNVVDNYIEDEKLFDEIYARYLGTLPS